MGRFVTAVIGVSMPMTLSGDADESSIDNCAWICCCVCGPVMLIGMFWLAAPTTDGMAFIRGDCGCCDMPGFIGGRMFCCWFGGFRPRAAYARIMSAGPGLWVGFDIVAALICCPAASQKTCLCPGLLRALCCRGYHVGYEVGITLKFNLIYLPYLALTCSCNLILIWCVRHAGHSSLQTCYWTVVHWLNWCTMYKKKHHGI